MPDDQVTTVIDLTGDDENDFLPPPCSQSVPKTGDKRPHRLITDPDTRTTAHLAPAQKVLRPIHPRDQRPPPSKPHPEGFHGFGCLRPNAGPTHALQPQHVVYAHHGSLFSNGMPIPGPAPYPALQYPPMNLNPYLIGFQPPHGLPLPPAPPAAPLVLQKPSTVDYRGPSDGDPAHYLSAPAKPPVEVRTRTVPPAQPAYPSPTNIKIPIMGPPLPIGSSANMPPPASNVSRTPLADKSNNVQPTQIGSADQAQSGTGKPALYGKALLRQVGSRDCARGPAPAEDRSLFVPPTKRVKSVHTSESEIIDLTGPSSSANPSSSVIHSGRPLPVFRQLGDENLRAVDCEPDSSTDDDDFSGVSPVKARSGSVHGKPAASGHIKPNRPAFLTQVSSSNAGRSSSPAKSIMQTPTARPTATPRPTDAPQPLPAQHNPTAYKCYAVRVGWFPGIYEVKDHCRYLTMHYPKRETERFHSRAAAQAWLDKGGAAAEFDAKVRPANYRNIDVEGWIHFLERTWLARDAEERPCDKRAVNSKLRKLFIEASEIDEEQEIDWNQHPLPQQLLRRDQLCDFVTQYGLDERYIRTKEEFRAPKRVCSCGAPAASGPDVLTCENSTCNTVNYHKRCVGLASRPTTNGWRCRHCRPTVVPTPSQAPPPYSTQDQNGARPSTPPPMYSTQIPEAARPVVVNGPAEPTLHAEQARVVNAILSGQNVFYTGSAGTGKSTVLKAFVADLRAVGKHVDIVAPSGIAALNVGGTTIFSYAGWVPDSFKMPLHKLAEKANGKLIHKRLCTTDVLVIDEISMVENHMLQRLDACMRLSRSTFSKERGEDGRWVKNRSIHNAKLPFGGVQVVVTGDFCQLPPVRPFMYCINCGGEALPGHDAQDGRPLHCNRCGQSYEDRDKWAFRCPVWEMCDFQCFELRQIHRQSEDARFIQILQRCRFGIPFTAEDKAILLQAKPDPVGAVQLLPRRNEVDEVNRREFNHLTSNPIQFQCVDFFRYRSHDQPELQRHAQPRYPNQSNGPLHSLKDHRLEEQVRLKQGMLVILLVNLDFTAGLVNGSQGRIIGFEKHDEHKVMASLFPQQDRYNKPGSPGGSKGFNELQQTKQEQIRRFIAKAEVKEWPVVQFHNGVTQTIYAQCQVNELGLEAPYSFLGRTQIPLLAAWAITVHKSQGMTLNRVIVDLWSSFEREMVYVALSRARGLAGLKVRRLAREVHGKKTSSVNEEVHEFLRSNDLLGSGTS